MIAFAAAAIALAGVCVAMPLYGDMDGPPCVDATVECGCSECMTWDRVDAIDRYEIERTTASTADATIVGTRPVRYLADDLTGDITVEHDLVWCAPLDTRADAAKMPHEGVLYTYRVRACKVGALCGPWSAAVAYRGAPYMCVEDGREIACYVGAPLWTR